MLMPNKADGFEDETLIVLSRTAIAAMEPDSVCSALYATDIGLFPHAANHYRSRPKGAGQNILIVCLDGSGFVSLSDGQKHVISKGQAFWVPESTGHEYGSSADDPWTILWFHFRGRSAADLCAKPAGEAINLDYETIAALRLVFSDVRERLSGDPGISTLRYLSLSAAYMLTRVFGEPEVSGMAPPYPGSVPVLEKDLRTPAPGLSHTDAIRIMSEHVEKPLNLSELAAKLNYSVSQFSARFKQQTGLAPMEYYRRIRIRKACRMLDRSSEPISRIARSCGFDDPLYFSRIFKQIMGSAPSEYRDHPKG